MRKKISYFLLHKGVELLSKILSSRQFITMSRKLYSPDSIITLVNGRISTTSFFSANIGEY